MSFDIAVTLHRGNSRMTYEFTTGPGLTALFGPSGAGKTSLLDAVAGLVRPVEGHIAVSGTVLFDRAEGINLKPEKRRCGYAFQDLRLFPHRTVRDNLLYGWKLVRPEERWLSVDLALDFLGIGHLLDRMPSTLSGGEAQRVAIGRALLSAPRFLLMDEPLASVDANRREEILSLIERIRDELELPILYVSHDRAEVERLAHRIIPVEPPSSQA
ncbi:molybdenum ABC transporter ATP-binding protein [Novosphingobium mangrovi (ex Huang et al. 2023)]|uniref:ATP-binding cassette domain-containing protein n=1 Tax=Novosphingobium mangrovi (ex Huang et al. 2023) TaxID=2976432 RepID=A0ABT2I565_9SPHN|nr:ATP-binding cassette domain-containing protein [Novosphingobium mangrovi (ex Huang et al. 2023)]MCT2399959.1 ATP-binding cassette domain-containing protein [Novosphingobium mangrovi (ex Huang et al. 2023)]